MPLAAKVVREGRDLILECAASGVPTPNVTWVLPNQTSITGSGASTLRIINIKRPAGQGKYEFECRANNIPGKDAIKRQTEVTVQCKCISGVGIGAFSSECESQLHFRDLVRCVFPAVAL